MAVPGTNPNNGLILSHDINDFKIDEELRDIKGFYAIEIPIWLWIILGLVLAGGLAWLIYRYLKHRNPERELSLYEQTLKNLESLDLGLSSKVFYLRYSELIKNYIERKLELHVMDKTADEMKEVLHAEPKLETTQIVNLANIFARADLAKFARQEISRDQRQADIARACEILSAIEAKLALATNPEKLDQFSDLDLEENHKL